jgi:hypothetical protein
MVSSSFKADSLLGAVVKGFSLRKQWEVLHFIGRRRLGAWEAVVFGEPHVENALAVVIGGVYSTSFLYRE